MSSQNAVLLILAGSFAISIYFVLVAKILKKTPSIDSQFLFGASNFAAAILLLPVWLSKLSSGDISLPVSNMFFYAILVHVILKLVSSGLHFTALKRVDVALVSSFSALSPILAILAGVWLLQEIPTQWEILGITIISVSILVFFVGQFQRQSEFGFNRYVFFAFLSAFPPAFAIIYHKVAVVAADAINFSFVSTVAFGCAGVMVSRLIGTTKPVEQLKQAGMSLLFLGLTLAITNICFSVAMNYEKAANVSALNRISVLMQVLLGYFFFGQSHQVYRRAIAAVAMLMGFLLIRTCLKNS